MNKISLLFFCLVAAFISFNCASTQITSYVDPDYRDSSFKKILVTANTDKLDFRLKIENTISNNLTENGTVSVASYVLFPPTRTFTDSVKSAVMSANKFDACLIVTLGEKGVENFQNPIIASTTNGTIAPNGTVNTTTTYLGGEFTSKPYAEFDLKLFDVKTGKMAWIANSITGGNAYADFETVYNSFCKNVVMKLSADKMIPLTHREQKILDGNAMRH